MSTVRSRYNKGESSQRCNKHKHRESRMVSRCYRVLSEHICGSMDFACTACHTLKPTALRRYEAVRVSGCAGISADRGGEHRCHGSPKQDDVLLKADRDDRSNQGDGDSGTDGEVTHPATLPVPVPARPHRRAVPSRVIADQPTPSSADACMRISRRWRTRIAIWNGFRAVRMDSSPAPDWSLAPARLA